MRVAQSFIGPTTYIFQNRNETNQIHRMQVLDLRHWSKVTHLEAEVFKILGFCVV